MIGCTSAPDNPILGASLELERASQLIETSNIKEVVEVVSESRVRHDIMMRSLQHIMRTEPWVVSRPREILSLLRYIIARS
jgi:hypothetical protein